MVVPLKTRDKVLEFAHNGHLGVERMKKIMRLHFWWPKMDRDITDYVLRCCLCQKARSLPKNRNLRASSETMEPFERLHVDVAHYNKRNYLCLYDSYSQWGDVHEIRELTSFAVINALKVTFKYMFLPKILVTDNATCFKSIEFRNFTNRNFINHIFSPAYHSQSNGAAERFIETFKTYLSKNSDVPLNMAVLRFCMHHNSSPTSNNYSCPASEVLRYTPRTALTASIEKNHMATPYKALVNRDGSSWDTTEIMGRIGSNTLIDVDGATHHQSRVEPLQTVSTPAMNKSEGQIANVPGTSSDTEMQPQQGHDYSSISRRSTRVRNAPQFYGDVVPSDVLCGRM